MGLDFDMSAEDIKVFLDEADEQLQAMEACILRLEKEPDNREQLQEIFRAAHTLKGSSATLGHRRMAEVTHAMENVLDKIRKGKLAFSGTVVDTLFACLDVLTAYKDEIATGHESGILPHDILARLAAIDGEKALSPGADLSAPMTQKLLTQQQRTISALPPNLPPLTAVEWEKLERTAARGLVPHWIVIRLDQQAPMPAVRAFQLLLALEDLGEIVRSWPSEAEVEQDSITEYLKVVFATENSQDVVRLAVQPVPDASLVELRRLDWTDWEGSAGSVQAVAAAALAVDPIETAEEAADTGEANGPADKLTAGGSSRGGRTAVRTVRVDVDVLDNLMSLVGELVIDRTRLTQVMTRLETDREGEELIQVMNSALAHIGRMTGDLQDEIQRARMLPVDNLFRKLPRLIRDTAQKAGKEVDFVIRGEETELDRSMIEEIGDPLMHLLRNAIDHGLEPPALRLKKGKPAKGTVTLEAFHEENHIIIAVRDDGRGMDPNQIRAAAVRKGLLSEEAASRMQDTEVVNLVWAPGFSTAEKVSDISGRGVGLDVVHKNIEKLNGSVEIKTDLGKGTEFRIKLPLTLAIIRSLQVQVLDTTYCIPLNAVVETDRIPVSQIQTVRQREVIVKRGEVVPLLRLLEAFELQRPEENSEPEEIFVVIVSVMNKQIGIVVDSLIGEGDVVIKPLGKFIGDVAGISGATIMGDGDVAIILDISSLVNSVQAELNRREAVRR